MNSKDQFDKHLADKFRQELEAFEPEYEPGAWDAFQSNLEQIKTNNGIARRAFMACTTFMLLFISLPIENFLNFSNGIKLDSPSASIIQNNENPNLTKEVVIKTDDPVSDISNTQTVHNSDLEEVHEQSIALFTDKIKKTENNQKDLNSNSTGNPVKQQVSFISQPPGNSLALITPEQNHPEENLYLTTLSFQKKDLNLSTENVDESLSGNKLTVQTGEANFASFFNQKWSLSFVGMGFMNYNSRTDNYKTFNGGLGILVNLPTQNRFQLSTGLVLQTLNSKTFPDQSQFAADQTAFEQGNRGDDQPIYNMGGSEIVELVTNTASLISVEIPVNLKFNLSPNSRTQFYFLGGLSSYFHIKEKYHFKSEKFEVISPNSLLKIRKVEETREYGSFNHFDPFATATLAFGIEKPSGRNTISFEPFLRLPIFKMGTEKSLVNTAGVVFKYNFGIGK
ncbi:MAG: hypothetical protein KTR26_11455 [Flammeovirgaceae bacterium]|nr:hypothetical protein [Flammeovirgaceae bacterium]